MFTRSLRFNVLVLHISQHPFTTHFHAVGFLQENDVTQRWYSLKMKEANVEWVNFPFISGMHAVDSQSAMALCCMHMQQTKRLCVSSF